MNSPAHVAILVIHKKPVGVRLLSLPNTRNASPVPCWIALTRRSRIEVPRVDYENLSGDRLRETSEPIRKRVQAASNIQQQRFASSQSDIICNAAMRVGEIQQFCRLQDEGQHLMWAAMSQLNLSARAYHRILKLARTIADLAGGARSER